MATTILSQLTAKATQAEIAKLWAGYEETITKHIVKGLIIIDDDYIFTGWLHEIENHTAVIKQQSKNLDLSFKYYKDLFERLKPQKPSINIYIKSAIQSYLKGHFKHIAMIRPCNLDTVIKSTSTILQTIMLNTRSGIELTTNDTQRYFDRFHRENDKLAIVRNIKELKQAVKGL